MADYEYTTGPEGQTNTGVKIYAPGTFNIPKNVGLAGGSVFIWADKPINLLIGGSDVGLAPYSAPIGLWQLYYVEGITASGQIDIVCAYGNTRVADLRCFAAALSDEALEYYYNDVKDNDGEIVIP